VKLSVNYTELAQSVLALGKMLDALQPETEACGVPLPADSDWYGLLMQKLIPQLTGGLNSLVLVAAVAGGTNTGKSVVFNHLAGENSSAADYRASGTKHPVCLIPKNLSSQIRKTGALSAAPFDVFQVIEWTNPEQALELTGENKLFWREGQNIPDGLAVIDTPDIDSDREANWQRAGYIRNAADVVIAVLTAQKYNDAAVRKFFREAAEAEKPVLLLFNMLDLPEDLQYVPQWCQQFCNETGVEPIAVVVAPHSKTAAADLTLPFYTFQDGQSEPVDLRSILTELHFDSIKMQTLAGAVKVLTDPKHGAAAYFDAAERASNQFTEALQMLDGTGNAAGNTAEVAWTGLPPQLLVEEIRSWWHQRRPGWSQNINSVYRKVGSGLIWGIGKAASYTASLISGNRETAHRSDSALEQFKTAEEAAAVDFVGKRLEQLKTLSDTANPVLRKELSVLIGGESREKLIQRAKSILSSMEPVDTEFRSVLDQRLTLWSEEHPKTVSWLQTLDNFASAARPLITVALASSGAAVGAHIAGPILSDIAVTTLGGETALQAGSEGISKSISRLFRQIQEDYVLSRSKCFSEAFQNYLRSDIHLRLQKGADVAKSGTLAKCRQWVTDNR
jgi:hypothetical protein